jgi:hypothetical protein
LTSPNVREIVGVMRPLRPAALAGAAIIVAIWLGAAHAETQPPYYYNSGAGFEIYSSRAWHGVNGTAGVGEVGTNPNHTSRDPDRSFRIWTPSCKPGQKFSVARSVDLLGPPANVSFAFEATKSVASTGVFINGHPVAKSVGNNSPEALKPPQLALFHPGLNELTVVVTLASTPTECTSDSSTPASVWFSISGGFASDLTVGAPNPGQTSQYFKADNGRSVVTHIHVTNEGRDLIPVATLSLQMGGPGFCVKPNADNSCDPGNTQFAMTSTESLGGVHCTTLRLTNVTCDLTNLKPGEKLFVTVVMRYRPDPADPGWTQEGNSINWNAQIAQGGPSDLDSSNNASSVTLVFCSSRATQEGCKTAQ